VEIGIPGIVAAKPVSPTIDAMKVWLGTLEQGLARNERDAIYSVLRDAVPDFRGEAA
jgi:O-antigen biosynthesis protein WbqV